MNTLPKKSTQSLISAVNLTCIREDRLLFNDLSFEINPGDWPVRAGLLSARAAQFGDGSGGKLAGILANSGTLTAPESTQQYMASS